jgi:hypothetical protein
MFLLKYRSLLMNDTYQTPYVPAQPETVQSLVYKLVQFSQSLGSLERALLMERIKRSLPNAETQADRPLAASVSVFAAWLNAVLPDGARWYPPEHGSSREEQ